MDKSKIPKSSKKNFIRREKKRNLKKGIYPVFNNYEEARAWGLKNGLIKEITCHDGICVFQRIFTDPKFRQVMEKYRLDDITKLFERGRMDNPNFPFVDDEDD